MLAPEDEVLQLRQPYQQNTAEDLINLPFPTSEEHLDGVQFDLFLAITCAANIISILFGKVHCPRKRTITYLQYI